MRSVALSVILAVCLVTSGCSDPNVSPIAMKFASSDTLIMGGNIRMVTERQRPVDGRDWMPTVCTEPSPDVAIAFGRTLALQASISPASGGSGSGSLNAGSTEEVTALAGRTAGVLALRDGLYAACQAFANGVIGHSAYALIMSQYGGLLVALAGSGTETSRTPFGPQDAAMAALLVGCISEYDPTRLGATPHIDRRTGTVVNSTNPMLDRKMCQGMLRNIANGKYLSIAHAAAVKSAAAKAAEVPKPKTTTIETTGTTKTTQSFDGAAK